MLSVLGRKVKAGFLFVWTEHRSEFSSLCLHLSWPLCEQHRKVEL